MSQNMKSEMQWQPIETVPMDGIPIDLWRGGRRLTNMRFVDLGKGNTFFDPVESGELCVRDATHWMPIPADPII
jgi:hypothetical protein